MFSRFVIVFDIGSTIIHPNYFYLQKWLQEKIGILIDVDLLKRAFQLAVSGDLYKKSSDEIIQQGNEFFTRCNINLSVNQILAIWGEIVESGGAKSWLYNIVDQDAESTLTKLKVLGCYVIAASNSNGTLLSELNSFSLTHFFDEIYDSKIIGYEKPDPAFYKEVLKSAPKVFSLHVGDDLINDSIVPSNCGFDKSLLYDPNEIYLGIPKYLRINRLTNIIEHINNL